MEGSVRLIDSTFVWDIPNFTNKCKSGGESIDSPYFAAGGVPLDKVKWYLRLYPFGRYALLGERAPYLSLFLIAKFCNDVSEIAISCKLYLWNANEINTNPFDSRNFSNKQHTFKISRFIGRNTDELQNHLSLSTNSTLSIACCIKSKCNTSDLNPCMELIEGYLNTFFLSEKLSDVTIEIDNKKLKAHQIILCARSEVFSAMFNHDMMESSERIIKITDISYDVMKEVLRYIYCGEVENLDLLSRDLLAAANKYGLFSLKRICNEALMKILSVSNACEILTAFHLYQCSTPKEKTIDFVINHLKEVVDTEGFKQIKDHILLADILCQNAHKYTVHKWLLPFQDL